MIGWGWLIAAFYTGALTMLLTLGLCHAAARGDRPRVTPNEEHA